MTQSKRVCVEGQTSANCFTISQAYLGSPLRFEPALGSKELDCLVNDFVPGNGTLQQKRAQVSLDFFNAIELSNLPHPVSRRYHVPNYMTSPSTASVEYSSPEGSASPAASKSLKRVRTDSTKDSSSKRLPGFSIMTRDGVDITEYASRGPKSKEQRDHAALMRKLKACGPCKRSKQRCDPSHHRVATSPATTPSSATPSLTSGYSWSQASISPQSAIEDSFNRSPNQKARTIAHAGSEFSSSFVESPRPVFSSADMAFNDSLDMSFDSLPLQDVDPTIFEMADMDFKFSDATTVQPLNPTDWAMWDVHSGNAQTFSLFSTGRLEQSSPFCLESWDSQHRSQSSVESMSSEVHADTPGHISNVPTLPTTQSSHSETTKDGQNSRPGLSSQTSSEPTSSLNEAFSEGSQLQVHDVLQRNSAMFESDSWIVHQQELVTELGETPRITSNDRWSAQRLPTREESRSDICATLEAQPSSDSEANDSMNLHTQEDRQQPREATGLLVRIGRHFNSRHYQTMHSQDIIQVSDQENSHDEYIESRTETSSQNCNLSSDNHSYCTVSLQETQSSDCSRKTTRQVSELVEQRAVSPSILLGGEMSITSEADFQTTHKERQISLPHKQSVCSETETISSLERPNIPAPHLLENAITASSSILEQALRLTRLVSTLPKFEYYKVTDTPCRPCYSPCHLLTAVGKLY